MVLGIFRCPHCGYNCLLNITSKKYKCPHCFEVDDNIIYYYLARVYRALVCTILFAVPLFFILWLLHLPQWLFWISFIAVILFFVALILKQEWPLNVLIKIDTASHYINYLWLNSEDRIGNAALITLLAIMPILLIDAFIGQFSMSYMGASLIIALAIYGTMFYEYNIASQIISLISLIGQVLDYLFYSFWMTFVIYLVLIVNHFSVSLSDVPFIFGLVMISLFLRSGSGWFNEYQNSRKQFARTYIVAYVFSIPIFGLEIIFLPGISHIITYSIFTCMFIGLYFKKELAWDLWKGILTSIEKLIWPTIFLIILYNFIHNNFIDTSYYQGVGGLIYNLINIVVLLFYCYVFWRILTERYNTYKVNIIQSINYYFAHRKLKV